MQPPPENVRFHIYVFVEPVVIRAIFNRRVKFLFGPMIPATPSSRWAARLLKTALRCSVVIAHPISSRFRCCVCFVELSFKIVCSVRRRFFDFLRSNCISRTESKKKTKRISRKRSQCFKKQFKRSRPKMRRCCHRFSLFFASCTASVDLNAVDAFCGSQLKVRLEASADAHVPSRSQSASH
jgi:hypothetical protein